MRPGSPRRSAALAPPPGVSDSLVTLVFVFQEEEPFPRLVPVNGRNLPPPLFCRPLVASPESAACFSARRRGVPAPLLRVLRGTGPELSQQVLPPPQHQRQRDEEQRGAAVRGPPPPAAAHLDGEGGPGSQPGPAAAGPAGPGPAPHCRQHPRQGRRTRTLPVRRLRAGPPGRGPSGGGSDPSGGV